MANGNAVLVYTQRLAGGPQAWDLYYVAEQDADKAAEIIRKATSATPDQEIKVTHPIPDTVVEILGLNDARWVHWKSSS